MQQPPPAARLCGAHSTRAFLDGWKMADADPTPAHHFCAWLHRKGWLRRVYTTNIDGLHTAHCGGGGGENVTVSGDGSGSGGGSGGSDGGGGGGGAGGPLLPAEMVVECHGSARAGAAEAVVLYDAKLPAAFWDRAADDFGSAAARPVDLVLVLGTALQVAPSCAIPNLTPKGAARVLCTLHPQQATRNSFDPHPKASPADPESAAAWGGSTGVRVRTTTMLAGREVPLGARLWQEREGRKKWRQLAVDSTCDGFVARFFDSPAARGHGHVLRGKRGRATGLEPGPEPASEGG